MSYVRSGYKWGADTWGTESGEVLWSMSGWGDLDYDTTEYSLSDFQGALQDAFDAWEDVAAIDFTYTASAGLADMEVQMQSLPGSAVGEAGMSFTGYNDPGSLISADVRFDSDEEWAPFGETDLSFFAVALHEIGHAIGLSHTSDNDQILYPYVTSTNTLGDGDIAGA